MIASKELDDDRWAGPDFASLGQRAFAQIIDFIAAGVFIVISLWLSPVLGDRAPNLGMTFALFYLLISDNLSDGQSYGSKTRWIQVVDARTYAPCGLVQSVIRNLLLCLGPIDWIFAFGAEPRRLGDRVAGTIVVRRPV